MEKEEKINIFSDKPIGKGKDEIDEFRHTVFADTIQKVIESFVDQDRDDSINIGLFGKWGSGKTSILNLLEKNIENLQLFLFSISMDAKLKDDTNQTIILEELEKKFKSEGFLLSKATVTKERDDKWVINGEKRFIVRRSDNELKIYQDLSSFSISRNAELENDLNKCIISEELEKKFKTEGFTLSKNATVTREKDNKWVINDEKRFIVRRRYSKLKIYQGQIKFVNFNAWGCRKTPILHRLEKIIEKLRLYWRLFSISKNAELENDLNKNIISEELKKNFEDEGFTLSKNATVTREKDDKWVITDKKRFIVREEDSELKIYQEQIKFVNFNAWKYSGESLRRQFLIFLDDDEEKGGLGTQTGVKDELYKSKQIGRSRANFRWKYFFITVALLLPIFLLPIFIKWITASVGPGYVLVIFTFFALFVTYLLTVLYDAFKKEIIQKEQVTETCHRLDQPDQFEDRFKEIIEKAKARWMRIVIAIDDIDRCRGDKATEMLRMIKNFLGEKDCIYIIPCDDEEIKKHLQKVMKYEKDSVDADEFLRKFFQVVLRIPRSIKDNVESYTRKLTKEAGFKEDVGDVVLSGFWEDPRRIKQFINNLTALRELAKAKEKEEEGEERLIEEGLVTKNLPFLAKIEAIRAKWPDLFKRIQEDNALLGKLDDVAKNGRDMSTVADESKNDRKDVAKNERDVSTVADKSKNDRKDVAKNGRDISTASDESKDPIAIIIKDNPGLKEFLNESRNVKWNEDWVPVFCNLGQPTYVSRIPEGERFVSLVLRGAASPEKREVNVNEIKELIKRNSKKNGELKGKYTETFKVIFDKQHKRGNTELAFNVLNAMVEICSADIDERGEIIGAENRARIGTWIADICCFDDMRSMITDKLSKELLSKNHLKATVNCYNIKKLTKDAGFEDAVGDVVSSAFWETEFLECEPSQSKSFIEKKLKDSRELAKARETAEKDVERVIEEDLVTKNLPFLAIIEAIKARWPELFKRIQEDNALLQTLKDVATNEEDMSTVYDELKEATAIINDNPGLKEFLNEIKDYKWKEDWVLVFCNPDQPTYISAIPDGKKFESLVLAEADSPVTMKANVNKIKEEIKKNLDLSKDEKELKERYTKVIKMIFDTQQRKEGNAELAFNAFNVMVEICSADIVEEGKIIGEENRARIGTWVPDILYSDDMWSRIRKRIRKWDEYRQRVLAGGEYDREKSDRFRNEISDFWNHVKEALEEAKSTETEKCIESFKKRGFI